VVKIEQDPVEELLGDALSSWRARRDQRALRRLLLRVLGEIED
jgi:hypothetical protein